MVRSIDSDTVSFDFGTVTLHAAKKSATATAAAYGLSVWRSSVMLCRMLEHGLIPPMRTGTLVELGAGNGFPGMLVAAMRRREEVDSDGARPPGSSPVLLTDNDPSVQKHLGKNVDLNGLRGRVEVAPLDWRKPEASPAFAAAAADSSSSSSSWIGGVPVEWVIGCDLLY